MGQPIKVDGQPETVTTQQNPAPQTQDSPQSTVTQPQPQPQQTAQPQPQSSHSTRDSREAPLSQLIDAVNAIPEKIVNGLREATQPPRQPAQSATQSQSSSNTSRAQSSSDSHSGQSSEKEPGNAQGRNRQQRFVGWWYGR